MSYPAWAEGLGKYDKSCFNCLNSLPWRAGIRVNWCLGEILTLKKWQLISCTRPNFRFYWIPELTVFVWHINVLISNICRSYSSDILKVLKDIMGIQQACCYILSTLKPAANQSSRNEITQMQQWNILDYHKYWLLHAQILS